MIRKGTKEDIPQVVEMAREFWTHTIYDDPFDELMCEGMVIACMDQGLLAVLDVDDKCEGFVCGVKSPLMVSPDIYMGIELAYWINPEKRQGSNAVRLLKFIESLAKDIGIKYWNMISMESSNPDVAGAIYKKLGYKLTEKSYSKVI